MPRHRAVTAQAQFFIFHAYLFIWFILRSLASSALRPHRLPLTSHTRTLPILSTPTFDVLSKVHQRCHLLRPLTIALNLGAITILCCPTVRRPWSSRTLLFFLCKVTASASLQGHASRLVAKIFQNNLARPASDTNFFFARKG